MGTKYNPPHCKGYAKGEICEGFTISCGREASTNCTKIALYLTFLLVLIVSGVALAMIYFSIKKTERATTSYSSMASFKSNSHKVMQRAFAFTITYLIPYVYVPWLIGKGYGWTGRDIKS